MPGPHTRTPAPTARSRRTPTARPEGGQSGEGERLTPDAPHNGERRSPQVTPFRHPHSVQCGPARAHAVEPVLDPHARTDRTRNTRVAESRLSAPEDGRQGEGQRPTPDVPHNGGRPHPLGSARHHLLHAAPTGHASQGDSAGPPHPHSRAHRTWVADPDSPPSVRAVGGGGAPDLRRPSQRRTAPLPGTLFRHPHSEQRRPARAHTVGPVLGPYTRINRTRGTRVAEPRLPAPEDRRLGEGQRLTPDAPHNGGRPPPSGTAPAAHSPQRACKPRRQCRAPTPAHPRPQHVVGGPRQPAQREGSRGRGSA